MTSGAHSNMGQSSPPHHLPSTNHPASPPSKRDLKSWWKNFKLPSKQHDTQHDHRGPGIFGVALRTSITYANVAISLVDENGQSYIYGYVPIVVAKCGVFLKEKATGIEGIFRLSGSEKRIKELKTIFDSPDRYGKGLVWEGYTVHDAANVLRRYLNDLPEPVVPLDLYEKFRDPLRGATKQAVGDTEGPQFVDNFDETTAIDKYQTLITELPPLNKQLLLYILDLLAVFAAKSDENRMTSQNLAAIFQPGMLSHPAHAMAPDEYRLNQCVIIFLIENQDHFLIGMQGTAADEKMMKEVASGTPNGPLTPNPNRKSGLGRTASNSSAGAESVRRDGKVRRNRSVSSRHSHSRPDGSVTPSSPSVLTTTTPTGGLARSNTVPSKKSPALRSANKFNKYESPSRPPRSPSLEPLSQLHPDEENLTVAGWSDTSRPSLSRSQDRLLEVPREVVTPTKERGSSPNLPHHHIFQRSPHEGSGTDKRQPNKLRKKRIPGSMSISAQSSCASLQPAPSDHASPAAEAPNPLEAPPPIIAQPQAKARPPSPPLPEHYSSHGEHHAAGHRSSQPPPQRMPQPLEHDSNGPSSAETSHRHSRSLGHVRPDGTLKSPPASLHSSLNEGSDDTDQVAEDLPASSTAAEHVEKEKKNRWRLSRSKREELTGSTTNIGANHHAEASTTSIVSGPSKPAKSCHGGDSSEHLSMSGERVVSHDGGMFGPRDDAKGPFSWIKNKYREAKENAEQRRAKSPPPETHAVFGSGSNMVAPRAGSSDLKRDSTLEDERRTLRQVTREEQMGDEAPLDPDEVMASHDGVEEEAQPVPSTAREDGRAELRHEDGAV